MHMFIGDKNKFIPIHHTDMLIRIWNKFIPICFLRNLIRQWNKFYKVETHYSYIPYIWAYYYRIEYIYSYIYPENRGINLFPLILNICLLESGINLFL